MIPAAAPASTPLWTAYEAAAATGGTLLLPGGAGAVADGRAAAADRWQVGGISFDTRSLAPGDLFAALEGDRDGHDFLGAARDAGAVAALVHKVPDDAPAGLPLLKVADTLGGLEALGAAARDRCFGRLIAVTGSVGKTTVKEMLRAALGQKARVHAARASFNNHLGVPMSLGTLPATSDYGIFEIGMNHAGEITPLTALVKPHVAIITAIAPAHLENFDNIEGIARAKAEILTGLRPGGAAVLPADSEHFGLLRDAATAAGVERILPFGETVMPGAWRLVFYDEAEGWAEAVDPQGLRFSFMLRAPGRHMALNALAVIAAAEAAGARREDVLTGIGQFTPGAGRGARRTLTLEKGTAEVLDESYNANPASMRAALALLKAAKPRASGRRIVVLGGMKELGSTGPALHAALAEPIADAGAAAVYLAGKEMGPLAAVLKDGTLKAHEQDATALLGRLNADLVDGDIVLFKGSNASRIGALLQQLMAKTGSPE